MITLQISKLENKSHVVAVLTEGEYVFGRGTLLQCEDKRVSRKHGVIHVNSDKVTITSTHTNPCFFIAANSKTITILKQGEPVEIHDSDKFGLLADQYWFTFKIKNVENVKSESESQKERASSKKLKQEENPVSAQPSTSQKIDLNETTPATNEKKHSQNNLNKSMPSWLIKTTIEQTSMPNVAITLPVHEELRMNETSPSTSRIQGNNASQVNGIDLNSTVCKNNEEKEVNIANRKRPIESDDDCHSENKSSKTEHNLQNASSSNKGSSDVEVIVEKPIETIEVVSGSEDDETNDFSMTAVCPKEENDKTSNDEDNIKVSENEENAATSNSNNEEKDKILENGNNAIAGPSNSNAVEDKTKIRRDRCWYGGTCYRKNQDHRKDYSHPGDSDYDSDPNDNRPMCAYGANCYRRNKEHRRDYRHPNTVLTKKKRTNKNDTTKGRGAKKKNVNYKESPEDDYDMEDPFIDDGSEDEFEITDSDISDSDWSGADDDEDEDTSRLIKEAIRFKKGRKKK